MLTPAASATQARETSQLLGKVPPHNLEAEESVLGAILLENDAINRALEILTPEDFYRQANQEIYSAMAQIYEKREPVDLVHLTDFLKSNSIFEPMGGATYLANLTRSVPSSANIVHYANMVKKYSILRQVIECSTEIIQKSYANPQNVEEVLDEAERSILSIGEHGKRQSFFAVKDVLKESIRTIELRATNKGAVTGVATRFIELDRLTCGFQPSDLIIIAGRPSMGKTAFSLDVACHAALVEKVPTAIFSLEMSKEQLVMRILCSEARLDSNKVRSGNLDDEDWRSLIQAASALQETPLYIDDTPAITAVALRSKARRMKKEKNIGLLVVDYLQLMRSSGPAAESREREISEISRSFKALARELSIPIIAISQLNRSVESRVDKRPLNSDLRESGALEQDADVIGFIYRDEVYHKESEKVGVAEFILGKQRNGPIGTVELSFLNKFTRFENLERI
jgi:replicative DNA helicase